MSLLIPIKVYDAESNSNMDLTAGKWRLTFKYPDWLPDIDIDFEKPRMITRKGKVYELVSIETNNEKGELSFVAKIPKEHNPFPVIAVLKVRSRRLSCEWCKSGSVNAAQPSSGLSAENTLCGVK